MDPLSPQTANLVSAVQALLVRQGVAMEGSTLVALLGQDVEVLVQALVPDGVKLQFPSGQTVTAQGELPYPEGTQLRVRILPAATGETGLRLQVQEARPPAPPALLLPLIQSEAATLAARLTQEPPLPELAPLVRLLTLLADGPRSLPAGGQLQAVLQELPGNLLSSLGRALGTNGLATIQELATALQVFLQDPQKARPGMNAEARLLEALAQQQVLRFQALIAQHPEIPKEDRDSLVTWIRTLLQKGAEETLPIPKAATPIPGSRTDPGARSGAALAADSLILPNLMTALQSHPGSKAELPESWEAWIRGSLTTLANPAISPREAPFHALQAKEGTAFFEIPLPWAQASPLQIWVESDPPEERGRGGDATQRVLLGLKFSQLGETRLGMAQGSFGLQIRIWTEHPEALEREKARMKKELEDLGKTVDLRIYALTHGPDGTIPSLRSLVVGPTLRALG